jgi:hypothetical protein
MNSNKTTIKKRPPSRPLPQSAVRTLLQEKHFFFHLRDFERITSEHQQQNTTDHLRMHVAEEEIL